ncbi:MAG: ImmA/IrrE family metallo-endopeptidase, partial [Chloroflexota bacterium]
NVRHFTAFHEGFHIICGSSGLAFKGANDRCQPVSERLADYFAASILMPKVFVQQIWPEVKDLSEMARIFSVPEPAVRDWLVRLRIAAT